MTEITKKYERITVEWVDAEGDCEWSEQDKIQEWAEKDCTIYEVGWLVAETKKYIVVTNQITYDGTIGNRTKIPVKWIKKLEYVTTKRKRKK